MTWIALSSKITSKDTFLAFITSIVTFQRVLRGLLTMFINDFMLPEVNVWGSNVTPSYSGTCH